MIKKNNSDLPPVHSDMNWIFITLKDKGIEFLLLGIAVWWLQQENVTIRREINQCQQEKIEVFRQENAALRDVITQCTMAITELKEQFVNEKAKSTKTTNRRAPNLRGDSTVHDPGFKK